MPEKTRALVVDDEADMCWALENILKGMGVKTVSTTSAKMALEHLETDEPFHLAFVDVKLPDMDGVELARLLRLHSPQTPIVLISGYYYKDDPVIKAGLGDIFIGFIEKPFDVKEIRQMVQKALPTIEKIP